MAQLIIEGESSIDRMRKVWGATFVTTLYMVPVTASNINLRRIISILMFAMRTVAFINLLKLNMKMVGIL